MLYLFIEDKHEILLHLSIFYEYQQVFSTPYLFLDTAATSTRKGVGMIRAEIGLKNRQIPTQN
jgi:hypothetical protein